MKERLHRPVVAFAPGRAGQRRAARLGAVDPRLPYPRCPGRRGRAASRPDRALRRARDGGGAVACRSPALAAFQTAFTECARERLDAGMLQAALLSDGELEPRRIRAASMPKRCATAGRGGRASRSRNSMASSTSSAARVVGERHLKLELGAGRPAPQRDPLRRLGRRAAAGARAHRLPAGAGRLPGRRRGATGGGASRGGGVIQGPGLRWSLPRSSRVPPFGIPSAARDDIKIGQQSCPTSDFRLPTSDFRLPTSEFRIPNSEFRIPNPESRIPNPESRIPSNC